jgi:hypothetical protein
MPGTGCQGLTIPEEECEQGIDELFLQYKPEGPIILWEELLWKEKGVALLGRGESGIPILPFGFLLFFVSHPLLLLTTGRLDRQEERATGLQQLGCISRSSSSLGGFVPVFPHVGPNGWPLQPPSDCTCPPVGAADCGGWASQR